MRSQELLQNVSYSAALPLQIFYYRKRSAYDVADIVMPHWHRALEMDCLLEGHSVMHIGGHGRDVSANEAVVINIGDVHSSTRSSVEEEIESVAILVDYDFIRKYYTLIDSVRFKEYFSPEENAYLVPRLRRIAEIDNNLDAFHDVKIMALLFEILVFLFENCASIKENPRAEQDKIADHVYRAIDYLNAHYREKVRLDDVAAALNLNSSYLSRLFRKQTGECFKDYLLFKRLDMAYNDMIRFPEKNVTQIAMDHGFPNLKSFIETFKSYYGVSPKHFLMEQRNNS